MKKYTNKYLSKIRQIFNWILIYIAIAGTISFSLFIIEEAFQTTMFSTWQSIDCQQWETVYSATKIMHKQEQLLSAINNSIGYLNPLSWLSYDAYAEASRHYILSLKQKVLANAPELFIGEQIKINIHIKSYSKENGLFIITLKNSKIKIYTKSLTNFKLFLTDSENQITTTLKNNQMGLYLEM